VAQPLFIPSSRHLRHQYLLLPKKEYPNPSKREIWNGLPTASQKNGHGSACA
jgi:hypothetical protein